MTLLHRILSARALHQATQARSKQRHPHAGVLMTSDDVMVAGRSLAELALSRGTPCVLIAEIPHTGRHEVHCTWVVARVTAVSADLHGRVRDVSVDANLYEIAGSITQTHIIGARATGRPGRGTVTGADNAAVDARLPARAVSGGLMVFRCKSTIALSQVRSHAFTTGTEDVDDIPWDGRCMK